MPTEQPQQEAPLSCALPLVLRLLHGWDWMITWGIESSSMMFSLSKPTASDKRIPVSLIKASNYLFSSSISAQSVCISTMQLRGIGWRSSGCSSVIQMLLHGLLSSIPYSAIDRLMMALIEPNILLIELTAKPLLRSTSRSLPASSAKAHADPATTIVLLHVSRNSPDKVMDTKTNTDIWGLIVRHSVHHLAC